ncbi:hypothetical protein [Chryseobacterium flavum]|uniref:hypothetical protein n=1 Tax=Chryseobacterium flavum TaxID=415851 RepID=UPI0028AFE9F5|nr:hypothetical protein [Chryseobacterium flavum]
MDLNLLTISRRAGLSNIIKNCFGDAETKILDLKNINNKIKNSSDFSDEEKLQSLEFTIIGTVSIFEHQINELLKQILISYPKKFKDRKFDIAELLEEGSVLELFQKKATQKILDLAYGKFETFIKSLSEILELTTDLDKNLINEINEIKCTRDCIIHSQSKATDLYINKAGANAREHFTNSKLVIDYPYVENAITKIQQLLNTIYDTIPQKYKAYNSSYVFKQMWEATCLSDRIDFNTAWEITNSNTVRPIDLEREYGFSSSEMVVYNLFRHIYNCHNYQVDFGFYFRKWKPQSKEYQIAISWLDYQFYF